MLPTERDQFLEAVCSAIKAGKGKLPLPADQLAAWWNTLKAIPIGKVLEALADHTKQIRKAPTPDDIARRISGAPASAPRDSRPAKDPRCTFEHAGNRCPALVGFYDVNALHGRCAQHDRHRADHPKCVAILEELIANGVPFRPGTPHRQRALFLFETQGEAAVLAEFDSRYVTWLRAEEALGHTAERSVVLPPRAGSVAEAAHPAFIAKTQEANL